jgi:hypothetical protein
VVESCIILSLQEEHQGNAPYHAGKLGNWNQHDVLTIAADP